MSKWEWEIVRRGSSMWISHARHAQHTHTAHIRISTILHKYMNMSLTWDNFSIFAHETKWENYYAKPHDENARILYISIIAICWISIITPGVVDFPKKKAKSCSSVLLSVSVVWQKLRLNETVCTVWNGKSFARTTYTRFFSHLIYTYYITWATCLFASVPATHAAWMCGLQAKINTQSHVWMVRRKRSGASVVVRIRTHRDIYDERTRATTQTHLVAQKLHSSTHNDVVRKTWYGNMVAVAIASVDTTLHSCVFDVPFPLPATKDVSSNVHQNNCQYLLRGPYPAGCVAVVARILYPVSCTQTQ